VELEGPNLDHVAVRQSVLGLDREFGVVDVGPVGAAQVHDAAAGRIVLDARVMQGNGGMLQAEVIIRGAPEGRDLLDKLVLLGCVAAFDGEGAKHKGPAGS
jgi:hypothetical protein